MKVKDVFGLLELLEYLLGLFNPDDLNSKSHSAELRKHDVELILRALRELEI